MTKIRDQIDLENSLSENGTDIYFNSSTLATDSEVNTTLSNYVTTVALEASYTTTATLEANYVTTATLNSTLSNYLLTSTALNTYRQKYYDVSVLTGQQTLTTTDLGKLLILDSGLYFPSTLTTGFNVKVINNSVSDIVITSDTNLYGNQTLSQYESREIVLQSTSSIYILG